MKNKILFLIILILSSFFGCNETLMDANYDEEYLLPVNKSIKTHDNKYLIHFDSVFYDSRCPEDVVCFWAGAAGIRLTVSDIFQSSETFEIYTANYHHLNMCDSLEFRNVKIKLLGLTPYPNTKKKINYNDFKAKIKITKLNETKP